MIKPVVNVLFLCLVLANSSCNIFNKDETYIRGVVKHRFTQKPISGAPVKFRDQPVGFLGLSAGIKGSAYSDKNGGFSIRINESLGDLKNFLIEIERTPGCLLDYRLCKIMGDLKVLKQDELSQLVIFELVPTGWVKVTVPWDTWSDIPGDSIVVSSPYETAIFLRNNKAHTFFVEPEQKNSFQWYYIHNGIKSEVYTKRMFVRNYYENYSKMGRGTIEELNIYF